MSEKASIGAGDIAINLGEKEYVLRPSLRAAKILSRKYGGTANIVQSLTQMNLDTFVDVIRHGAGLTEHGAKNLEEEIFSHGLFSLTAPCIRYMHILSNGGRPPSDDGDEDENPRVADPS